MLSTSSKSSSNNQFNEKITAEYNNSTAPAPDLSANVIVAILTTFDAMIVTVAVEIYDKKFTIKISIHLSLLTSIAPPPSIYLPPSTPLNKIVNNKKKLIN